MSCKNGVHSIDKFSCTAAEQQQSVLRGSDNTLCYIFGILARSLQMYRQAVWIGYTLGCIDHVVRTVPSRRVLVDNRSSLSIDL